MKSRLLGIWSGNKNVLIIVLPVLMLLMSSCTLLPGATDKLHPRFW